MITITQILADYFDSLNDDTLNDTEMTYREEWAAKNKVDIEDNVTIGEVKKLVKNIWRVLMIAQIS